MRPPVGTEPPPEPLVLPALPPVRPPLEPPVLRPLEPPVLPLEPPVLPPLEPPVLPLVPPLLSPLEPPLPVPPEPLPPEPLPPDPLTSLPPVPGAAVLPPVPPGADELEVQEASTRAPVKATIHSRKGTGEDCMAAILQRLQQIGARKRPTLSVDRDPLYTEDFRGILTRGGVSVLRLPPQSPDLNAFAEQSVLSVRTEYLNRIVLLGEAHLPRTISELVEHYHHERNHQGIDNVLIVSSEGVNGTGKVVRHERLGGLLGFSHREAA